jgi:hypothetical protein
MEKDTNDEYQALNASEHLFIGVVALFAIAIWCLLFSIAPVLVETYLATTILFFTYMFFKETRKPVKNERQ